MKETFKASTLGKFGVDVAGLPIDAVVERKTYSGDIQVQPGEERTVVARISTIEPDADGDVMLPQGADFGRFRKNSVVHADHSYQISDVIGRVTEVAVDQTGITAKIVFASTPRAEDAWQLVKGGFVKANSIGFLPIESYRRGTPEFDAAVEEHGLADRVRGLKDAIRIVARYELLETSIVSMPCNPSALMTAISEKSISLTPKTIKMLDLPGALVKEALYPVEPKAVEPQATETAQATVSAVPATVSVAAATVSTVSVPQTTSVETPPLQPTPPLVAAVAEAAVAPATPVEAPVAPPRRVVVVLRDGPQDVAKALSRRQMAARGKVL